MSDTPLVYRAALRLAMALAPIAAAANAKIAAGHRGRRGAVSRLRRWAISSRDPGLPLVWVHAASVGEGLQAEIVIQRLRERRPDAHYVYTHFSPSAEALAARVGADVADYLPYDTPRAARALLDALRPDLLVYSKLDLWPELASRAVERGCTVALSAATVSPGSGRLRWPARALLRPGYAAVRAAAAISDPDAERLARLGVRREYIRVLGDPRYDSVAGRVRAVPPDDPLLRFGAGAPTLVAGSTWPGDEAVLLDAFARLHVHRPDARLILVPHEPTAEHLTAVERAAARLGLPAPVRLSSAVGPVPLLLVDRVGVLAALYGAGGMAYVGGGFGGAGLHSVLEPAAWGVPVAFGPRWQESRDAALLLRAGAAESLAELGTEEAGEALQATWEDWIVDPARRQAQGGRARRVVEDGLGAAERTGEWLALLLERSGAPSRRPLSGRRAPSRG